MFHHSLPLLVPSVMTSSATLTLQITSGSITLVNDGTSAVTVTDGTNPVTGCTLVISDGSKASASGQNLLGKAESGSCTVYATKVGYTQSATITVTCSGGLVLRMDPLLGTNTTTNGANVTSWVDQSSTAASFGEAITPPTYLSSGLNGAPAIRFNGTNQLLSTLSVVSALNPGSFVFTAGLQTSSDGGGTNRSCFGNVGANTGYSAIVNTSNQFRWTVGTGSTTATISGGSILAASGHYLAGIYDSSGSRQDGRADGVALTGQGTGFSPNVASVARIGTNNAGTGNFFPGDVYYLSLYNRLLTATEIAQAELTIRTRMGL